MSQVDLTANTTDFQQSFATEMTAFKQHLDRTLEQYKQINILKNELHQGHCTIQVDFAEAMHVVLMKKFSLHITVRSKSQSIQLLCITATMVRN